jgi:tRNA G46 methylase TrmB
VAAGLDTRCGFSDSLSKDEANQTFERMVAMGVVEVGCGRPDWIAEFIAAH